MALHFVCSALLESIPTIPLQAQKLSVLSVLSIRCQQRAVSILETARVPQGILYKIILVKSALHANLVSLNPQSGPQPAHYAHLELILQLQVQLRPQSAIPALKTPFHLPGRAISTVAFVMLGTA